MMKNKKYLVVLSVIALLCLCMCLSACGKNKKANAKDKTAISNEQTNNKKDKKSSKNKAKESDQKQDQPKVVKSENGSGVEVIGANEQSESTTQSASSQPTTKESTPTKQLSSEAQEYANYIALSTEDQYSYYKKFKSADDFMNWYNRVRVAYEKENPTIVLEPGAAIDLGGN